jgi:hypothetical protein
LKNRFDFLPLFEKASGDQHSFLRV